MNLPLPVLLVGVHGHGRSHLRKLLPLVESGAVRLAGVCDTDPPGPDDSLEGHGPVPAFTDLDQALEATKARVTIVVTPIHTHLPLARTALQHGSHLLLEKPTTATLAEFEELTQAVAGSGLACQVGFQSLGSHALEKVRSLMADGAIGTVQGIGGHGAWARTSHYYARAPWAGRRRLRGRDVVDGALTNPFAHAVATALALTGTHEQEPDAVELELYRAGPIEADDTSCVRVHAANGTPITIAVSLCAPVSTPPRLIVHGDRGSIELDYTLDRLTLHRDGQEPVTTTHQRTGLMENLLAHVGQGEPLLVPPSVTRAFTHVVEAVRLAPDPVPVPQELHTVQDISGGTHDLVTGISELVQRSAKTLSLFSELDPAWKPATREDSAHASVVEENP